MIPAIRDPDIRAAYGHTSRGALHVPNSDCTMPSIRCVPFQIARQLHFDGDVCYHPAKDALPHSRILVRPVR